ncbi:MAG: HflC protein [Desulfobacteraceae bacterium 4572_19]|nr:MAG: HflC protein [Desulfobacteraceae bacterium 4572_19]
MKLKGIILVVLIVVGVVAFMSAYVVDETQQVVVTQFGKVVGKPITTPGLKFKIPFAQIANFFPNNLQEWDGDPGQIPTLDKTYIWVDTFARWKIVDPVLFFQTVNNITSALGRLDDIIDPAVRNMITSYRLVETVRNTDRELDIVEVGIPQNKDDEDRNMASKFKVKVGRDTITKQIMLQAKPKLASFGIDLVDVEIKRINYVAQVRKSVYERMIAERSQIAEKFRAEGKGEAQKILGDKERELKKITSEAYMNAQKIKGEADAKVTTVFADAYGVDPEFYSFIKTMEVYGKSLDKSSSLVLSTKSEFLKYLKSRN